MGNQESSKLAPVDDMASTTVSPRALQEVNDELRDAQQIAHYGSWSWDIGSNKVLWSDELFRIYGVDPRSFPGTFEAYMQRVHPGDRERVKSLVEDALADRQPFEFIERIVRPDGVVRVLQSRGKVYLDASGNPVRLAGVCLDVTERERISGLHSVQHQVANVLAESPPLNQALASILSIVGLHLRMDFGQVWLVAQGEDLIEPATGWHAAGEKYEKFLIANAGMRFARGDGFPGLVWQRAEPVWVPDIVDDPRSMRAAQAAEAGLHALLVFPLQAKGQTIGVVEFLSHQILQPDRDLLAMLAIIGQQIGEFVARKRTEAHLREIEERFRLMIDSVRDYAIFMLDLQGNVVNWNAGAEHLKGYKAHEIIGKHFSRFFSRADVEEGKPQDELRLAVEQGRYEELGWRVRKDGSQFWAHVTITAIRDAAGEIKGFAKVTHDVTRQKWTEEELRSRAERLQSLSRRLAEVQEDERRGLARELHDRVGQKLTALSMNFNVLRGQIPPDMQEKVGRRLEDCAALIEQAIESIRDVMADLRPAVLDEYGLAAALRTVAESFQARTGVVTTVTGEDPRPRAAPLIEGVFYRIAEEALNNLAKHARASKATISLNFENRKLVLSISDNGVGFDQQTPGFDAHRGGWGLIIMRERAQMIGGQLRVESAPGRGTRVTVEVAH